ncbi:MAG: hypothetical protein K2O06_09035 [Acetatifactor sp.]|nr:hypothetical protein [Acetatifactor sp.]
MKKIQRLIRLGLGKLRGWCSKAAKGLWKFCPWVVEEIWKFPGFLEKAMLKRNKSACWMNIATLLTGFAAFEVYRSLSFDEAEYQGETLLYYFSVAAPVIIWSVIAWELICLIGVRRWKDIWAGIVKRKRGLLCIAAAAIAAVCIGSFWYCNTCETQYFDEVVEFYGIPDGVGDPLTEEQRKDRAGYWRIDDYPGKHRLILTYVDAYGQLELMRQYSTAYDRMLFQPVARIEYCYKKSKDKFRALGSERYKSEKEHGFREPEKITYYASNGKMLLELSGDGYEKLKVDFYASEETVQLLNSTLFRLPEGQTAGNSVTSWQMESSYDYDGRPALRKLSAGMCNLYGINGERYTYDAERRLESICYLDVNGMPACNKQGIMLITFQYDEEGGCKIAYYCDESAAERTEGFHGVYCEELTYDSNGNITQRQQKDKQGSWCCDANGVYKYIYEYDYEYEPARLKSEAYKGVDELPVRINGWDSQTIGFSLEMKEETKIIGVLLNDERTAQAADGKNGAAELYGTQVWNKSSVREAGNLFYTGYDAANNRGGRADNQEGAQADDQEGGRTNNQTGNRIDSQEGGQANNQADNLADDQEYDGEKKRNYTRIRNTIENNSLLIEYLDNSGNNIQNKAGYAKKKVVYDEKMRIIEVAYLDLNGDLCLTEDGYAVVRTQYRSEDDDKIEFVEYWDADDKPTMNQKEGYSYVRFQYGRQGESQVITSTFYDSLGQPVYLPGRGYAAVERLYDRSGFLIQETYRDENGVITYRNDYMVAEILYEYGDDGNLSRIWYKDAEERPANRLDTGYAVVYQEYEAGQLVRRRYEGYRNGSLCPVPDKTTGIYDAVYQYTKGKLQQEQYFDDEGSPALRSDLGCAAISYEYDDNGNISCRRYYGTDGKLILRKDTGYAVIKCEYNDEEQYKLFQYLGVDEQPVIHSENHCAGIREIYEGDNLVEIQYLGLDGNLMNRSDYGIARVYRTYYNDGKQKTEEYFDAEGNPAVRKEYGCAMFESFYYDDGALKERRYYAFPEGRQELVMRRDTGYAIIRYEYDGNGNRKSQTYFDADEQPVVSTKYHCAGILSEYDDYGNEIETRYVDWDGGLMNRDDYGFARVLREYDSKMGKLLSERYFDAEGRPAIRKEYGYAFYEQYYDERGNWLETRYYKSHDKDELVLRENTGYAVVRNDYNEYGELSAKRFYDEAGMPAVSTEYHCAGILYDYDKQGRRSRISYLGLDGKPADRSDYGCAYVSVQYDDAGRVVQESYFGVDGRPVIRKDRGYASFKKVYEDGKLVQEQYSGLSKEPVPDKDTGYAMIKWEYDEYGNTRLASFYGVDGKPVISSKYQCAGIRSVYDEKGNNSEIWYLNWDGELMNRGDYGCAKILQEFDGSGDIVKAYYFDAGEDPIIRKDLGYASFEKIYDSKTNRWSESRYFDTQPRLTIRKDYGYALIKVEYDPWGREKAFTYYGTDEEPIICSRYSCAGMEYFYDEKGNKVKIQYLSADGSLMTRIDLGCAQVEKKYSDSGRLIGEAYLDTEGEAAVRKERGYASYEEIYSGNGLLLESKYYGLDGSPVLRKDMGYAVVRYSYDAYGRIDSQYFFGTETEEQLVISSEYNCAGISYRYENGNEVEIRYYGLYGQLMNRDDYGCAQILKEYDDFGYLKREIYFDAEGERVIRKDLGYAICEKEYDPYHRWVEDRYYNIQEKLTLKRDIGVAILTLERDAYGREGQYMYYGRDEQPILHKKYKCYGMRYSYDELGNQTVIQYLSPEGEMMLRSDLDCMQVKQEYDAWGRLIKETYCDAEGEPVSRPEHGYAAYFIDYEYDRRMGIGYLDSQGSPTVRTDVGYATARYAYNELGQRTEESYHDAEDHLVLHKEFNCAKIKNRYDERGNRAYIWYYGLDGKRIVRKDSGAMVNYMVYDAYDRMTWDAYYIYEKPEYQPVIRKDMGYFAIRYTYNKQGKYEKKQYLDVNKDPVMHKTKGYAECRWFYNESGQLEYLRYYDKDEKPVNIPEGYAEKEYIYDASGNAVDWIYRDAAGNEVTPK